MQRRLRKIPKENVRKFSKNNGRRILWLSTSAFILLVINQVIIPKIDFSTFKKPPSGKQIRKVRSGVQSILYQYGIRDEWIISNQNSQEVHIPTQFRFYQMYGDIVDEIITYDANVCSSSADLKKRTKYLEINLNRFPILSMTFINDDDLKYATAKVAIIIDDFGYAFDSTVQGFISLPSDITLSIIPGLKYSKRIAQEAYHNGKEVMIHLPMQPLHDTIEDLGFTIFTDQSESEIRKRVQEAFTNVPFAKGVNNHMGSKASSEDKVMRILLSELYNANLFFVDSKTTPNSVTKKVASEINLPVAERDVFIDTEEEETVIRKQLDELCSLAFKKGSAVGIGHAKKLTLTTLSGFLSENTGKGIEFVFASELVE